MIYIMTHKKFDVPKGAKQYPILQVGAILNEDLHYLKDSEGDNISMLNPYFCELTGIYWLWKNCQDKYLGVCHYRRYFLNCGKILEEEKASALLDRYGVILPQKDKFATTVYKQYAYSAQHNISDFDKAIQIIQEKYADYSAAIDKVINEKYFYPFNMMIMKKELFDSYCSWLFDILFQLEQCIPYKTYDQQKKRVFGYLSERLLLIWIVKNNIVPYELEVLNTEYKPSLKDKIATRMKTFLFSNFGIDFRTMD